MFEGSWCLRWNMSKLLGFTASFCESPPSWLAGVWNMQQKIARRSILSALSSSFPGSSFAFPSVLGESARFLLQCRNSSKSLGQLLSWQAFQCSGLSCGMQWNSKLISRYKAPLLMTSFGYRKETFQLESWDGVEKPHFCWVSGWELRKQGKFHLFGHIFQWKSLEVND